MRYAALVSREKACMSQQLAPTSVVAACLTADRLVPLCSRGLEKHALTLHEDNGNKQAGIFIPV